jgi:hypothetical protein
MTVLAVIATSAMHAHDKPLGIGSNPDALANYWRS